MANIYPNARPLAEIIEAMKEANENSAIEVAHGDADDLLVEALQRIANTINWMEPSITELIEAYDKVPKCCQ